MIALIQRVSYACVIVNDHCIGEIDVGLLALVAIQPNDNLASLQRMATRLLNYRVFEDEQQRMNLSLSDIDGGLLLVPQFTLAADTRKGNRPSFSSAAAPAQAQQLFETFVCDMKQRHHSVATGQFGTDMQVSLTNEGPVTFWLQT